MPLSTIVSLSRFYGANPEFVLAGGGNTSFKDSKILYVKPSGVPLATINDADFVKMDRAKLHGLFSIKPPADATEREALVKGLMAEAVCRGSTGRPSVEAPLHEIIPSTYVVHLHPAMVNGMTCGAGGAKACARLFPDALWVDYTDPGFTLARKVADAVAAYTKARHHAPSMIILQNHGVFVGADSEKEVKAIYSHLMTTLAEHYKRGGIPAALATEPEESSLAIEIAPRLRSWLGSDGRLEIVTSGPAFEAAQGPLTPDHVVYAKSYALIAKEVDKKRILDFEKKNSYKPLVVSVEGKAVFCAGSTLKNALTTMALARDAALVQQYSQAFGGPRYLTNAARKFIENWEVESYRKKVTAGSGPAGRLMGKTAVVTGAAQGFGFGIAEGLAKEGATVAVADLNLEGAAAAADKLNATFGAHKAFAVKVDISTEESVAAMVAAVVGKCGGIDLLVANAGVLKAGSVKAMTKRDWDFVTNINYSGYFLCVKHAAPVMARQNAESGTWSDIVQINSKSGLVGSNKNGAYAGSKFGTIGLTQSFALELVEDKIKVNSVCPGNFFDGPLWMDSKNGLFVQYLKSGKVPGAKTVEDVKRSYESKVPMNRGCFPEDVVKAIIYSVDQTYETGQAIPVTGGQVMLA